jgi:carbonic anhydrase/acetyltransferase-like protein (isoleucine patch superfamily)
MAPHDSPALPGLFVHPTAVVVGDVVLAPDVSIWPLAVLRGDCDRITVGPSTNIQDHTVVHVDYGVPTTIGARVAIGHRALIHGATIEDDVLIGMGAVLLNRVRVGAGSIVGAGAVCPEGMTIPPGSLVLGVPGRVVRQVTSAERDRIRATVQHYLALKEDHRAGKVKPFGAR